MKMYITVFCVRCISLTKYCLDHYSLTQLKVELGCLNSADTGENIHTSAAMTPVYMSNIIFNPLITNQYYESQQKKTVAYWQWTTEGIYNTPICTQFLDYYADMQKAKILSPVDFHVKIIT
jgi:hypothetical protein